MGQRICGRMAAALMMSVLGISPAFAMDRFAMDRAETARDSAGALAARPCPTRFDYLVLASFADAPSLLSLSTYHFRSEAGFSTIPITGLLQVGYAIDSGGGAGGDCRSGSLPPQLESS